MAVVTRQVAGDKTSDARRGSHHTGHCVFQSFLGSVNKPLSLPDGRLHAEPGFGLQALSSAGARCRVWVGFWQPLRSEANAYEAFCKSNWHERVHTRTPYNVTLSF